MTAKLVDIKRILANDNYRERVARAKQTSKECNWLHWYGDCPVPQEMVGFLTTLQQSMPSAKLIPAEVTSVHHAPATGVQGRCFIIDEFCVVMDEFPFDLGRVGFRNYAVKKDSNKAVPSYGVYSRKIMNDKYGTHRDQYHMIMSADANKAVKNACKYLVPYTHKELATAFYDSVHRSVSTVYDKAQNKMRDVSRIVTNSNQEVLAELLHLKSLGIQFKTEAFKKAAEQVEEAVAEARAEEVRKVQMLFVRCRKVGEDMYVDVQEVDDVRRNSQRPEMSSQPTTYPMSSLPEDIVGSISVLSILSDGQYVDKVGQKIDEVTYYIERG